MAHRKKSLAPYLTSSSRRHNVRLALPPAARAHLVPLDSDSRWASRRGVRAHGVRLSVGCRIRFLLRCDHRRRLVQIRRTVFAMRLVFTDMTNFAHTPNPSNHHAASLDKGVVEFGLHTFGDLTQDVEGTRVLSYPEVLRNVVAEGVLADEVGIDVIGIGEHHRPDYAISAPDIVLTGIGAQTERIKLISAVTVLSSDDPVRVHQRFATLDGIASGRAEVSLGRGSFIESFPLFGYDLA